MLMFKSRFLARQQLKQGRLEMLFAHNSLLLFFSLFASAQPTGPSVSDESIKRFDLATPKMSPRRRLTLESDRVETNDMPVLHTKSLALCTLFGQSVRTRDVCSSLDVYCLCFSCTSTLCWNECTWHYFSQTFN